MKTVLVTGGLGYIGAHTVVELVANGYRPIIVDNLANSSVEVVAKLQELTAQQLIFYQADFQDPAVIEKILADHAPVGVIHFAAFKFVGESVSNPLAYYANNVSGMVSLLQCLAANERPLGFVFSSSCTVYGDADVQPITEDSPTKPAASPYGATKQMCEQILRDVTASSVGLKSLALRYFNPIGAHESGKIGELPFGVPANLIPFLTQTAAGFRDSLTIFGNDYPTPDGTCVRDYIHVVDLAKAHIKALEYALNLAPQSFDTFNIGTGQPSSVLDVITQFEAATGQKIAYTIGPRRQGDIVTAYADSTKAQKLLGWRAHKSLQDGLRDAWHWQQTLDHKK